MPVEATEALYQTDVADWCETQAAALERHDAAELDWANLAEEISSLGISLKHAIRSHLRTLLIHLIKYELQPNLRSASWRASIVNARSEIADLIEESPSLKRHPREVFEKTLAQAYADALVEMNIAGKPSFTSWTLAQALAPEFFPGWTQ